MALPANSTRVGGAQRGWAEVEAGTARSLTHRPEEAQCTATTWVRGVSTRVDQAGPGRGHFLGKVNISYRVFQLTGHIKRGTQVLPLNE